MEEGAIDGHVASLPSPQASSPGLASIATDQTPSPAVLAPSPRKRSMSSRSDGRLSEEPMAKRQRVEEQSEGRAEGRADDNMEMTESAAQATATIIVAERGEKETRTAAEEAQEAVAQVSQTTIAPPKLRYPPPKPLVPAVVTDNPFFDDNPRLLLERSVALALQHVGFSGASKEALESFCAEASAYAERFLSYVTESMLSARRAQSIPQDFEYALRREGLTDKLLRPHLKPPIPKAKAQIHLELQEAASAPPKPVPELLGKELSGASEKLLKSYIPKKFPDFPSKHTYKATEVMPVRESDPRKIREKATEAARHGEEALRRLVKVGKVSDQKGVRKASEKNSKNRIKHELWVKAMEALSADSPAARKKDDDKELDQSIMVDAGRKYGRKPVPRVRT